MGLYDTVQFDEPVDLPGFEGDPTEVEWQTKTFDAPFMEEYRVTGEGTLLKEDARYEEVPEDERPYADHPDFDEEPMLKMCGMLDKVREGWNQVEYHGWLRISQTIDGERYKYDLKFTDGKFVDVTRVE